MGGCGCGWVGGWVGECVCVSAENVKFGKN